MSMRTFLQNEITGNSISRRTWLGQIASVAFGAAAVNGRHTQANASKPPRSCIVLWMSGGPSQMDTFDLKPGHENGGPFKEISTSVPGIKISEHLPKIAEQAEHLAIVRSMSTVDGDHGRATEHLHTGYQRRVNVEYPCLGSLFASENSSSASSLPAFVNIAPPVDSTASKPGFLGSRYSPMIIRPVTSNALPADGDDQPPVLTVDYLLPPSGTVSDRAMNRADLLQSFNRDFALRQPDAVPRSHQIAFERAIKLMHPEAASAFDLLQESAAMRNAYGIDSFGQGCLMARRLVERGVGFVEVTLGGNSANWDTHAQNFQNVQRLSETLDRAWSQLIVDLKARGMLESTVVVWMGEFGRTPKINSSAGRDHFPNAWSTVLAGGGIQGGQVVGRTNAAGTEVEDRPVSVPDFMATICRAVGIDPKKQNLANDGQPIRIVDADAKSIDQILTL